MFDYDAELVRYDALLRAAAAVGSDDHVLDIGCGAGQTTREAARTARSGDALGVDVSPSMIDLARRAAADEGISNVRFEIGDAQTHRLAPGRFTVGISRFGTMFFDDPVAALANIGTAMEPGARLVQVVWQAQDHQEWSRAIRHALTGGRGGPAERRGGAFSFADPTVPTDILAAAGFTSVDIDDVREPIYYGRDTAGARDALVDLGMIDYLVPDLEPREAAGALDRLSAVLEDHDTGEGVWFDSAAWLVTAVRAG